MDISLQKHRSYLHKHVSSVPTPALILSQPIIKQNIKKLLDDVSELGISFRPHVKTLKSIEVTRMMLDYGKHRAIVASTICEIEGALPLVQEGILDECLYGIPITRNALVRLASIAQSSSLKILLLVDNEQQLDFLEEYTVRDDTIKQWEIFIKVDVGSHRAGVAAGSPSLSRLIHRVQASSAVSLYGLYCHAGHSYSCRTQHSVESVLKDELSGVVQSLKFVSEGNSPLVLSIGSTPTAHVVSSIKDKFPSGLSLELHAGNFPTNDLQQVSTNVVEEKQQAVRIMADVCSVYPERNEALINAGAIALSREVSAVPGFGRIVDKPDWHVVRLSQEHGILGILADRVRESDGTVERNFHVNDRVFLYCQHSCITAAAFHVYYVVDENDVVCDTWVPWKGW